MDAALIVIALSLAAQAGWSPDRYDTPPLAAAPTYDRYQAPPTGGANSVSLPPSITDRARNAATETATTLRDGFEAGVQAANQQVSQGTQQFYDNTRAAGQEFAEEFQNWAGTASQEFVPINAAPRTTAGQATTGRGQVTNPFAPVAPAQPATAKSRNGLAAPPWAGATATTEPDWGGETVAPINIDRTAALGAGPVRTDSGWTRVSSDLAPPSLLVPRLRNTAAPVASPQQANAGGPSFPSPFTGQPPAERSVVTQSPQQTPQANADDGWALGWGTNAAQPATIGRYDPPAATATNNAQQTQERLQAEPVAARPQNLQNTQQTAQSQAQGQQFDPWGDNNPWANPVKGTQGPQQPASTGTAAQPPVTIESPQTAAAQTTQGGWGGVVDAPGAQQPSASLPPVPGTAASPGAPTGTANAPTNAVAPPATTVAANSPVGVPKTGDEPPWVPLLVVSLSLAGSIGANLFLGWSYMDARQKYRSLVQKTANTFRRATAAA